MQRPPHGIPAHLFVVSIVALTFLMPAPRAVSADDAPPVAGTYMVGGQSWIVLRDRWLRGPVLESGRFWEAAMPHMVSQQINTNAYNNVELPELEWSVDDGLLKAEIDGKVKVIETRSGEDGKLGSGRGAKKQVILVRMTFVLEPSSTINGDWDLVVFSGDIKSKHGVRVWTDVLLEAASRLSPSDIDGVWGTLSNLRREFNEARKDTFRTHGGEFSDHIELSDGLRLNSWLHRTSDPRVPRFLDNRMSREVTDEDLELIRAIHADAPHDPFLSLHATEMEALYGDLETAEEIWRQWLDARGDRGPDTLRDSLACRIERTVHSIRWRTRHPNLPHYADILAGPHDKGPIWPDRVPEGGYGMLSLNERMRWLRRLGKMDTPTLRTAPILRVFGAEGSPLPGFYYRDLNFMNIQNAAKTGRIFSAFALLDGRRNESLETLMGIQYVGRSLACESRQFDRIIGAWIQQISTAGLTLHLQNACETAAETEAFLGQLAHLRALDDALRFAPPVTDDRLGGLLAFVESSLFGSNHLEAETRMNVSDAHFNLLEAAARTQLLRQQAAEAGRDRAALAGPAGLPRDPFGEGKSLLVERGPAPDLYATFWSVGPDRADDGAAFEYDPTNGAASSGDIVLRMPRERRYPFPHEGVRADSAFELLEMFPHGMPLDPYNTVSVDPHAGAAIRPGPVSSRTSGVVTPPLSIVDATTTQPLRVFSPGPRSRNEPGLVPAEPLPPVPTPQPDAIAARLLQRVIYPDTVLVTPTPAPGAAPRPAGAPIFSDPGYGVAGGVPAGYMVTPGGPQLPGSAPPGPPPVRRVFDPTPYDPTNGKASAGSLILEIPPRTRKADPPAAAAAGDERTSDVLSPAVSPVVP